eukprot:TRINITY_DN4521_c0_g1_i1.p1 TRINITY_DN4521_c0_g1~~TRINITY_DN4521_c0_g1_i1.p1  ORF type:complete len:144 (-),score=34.35 TRINITY_DN4521_c0_g1_i1:2-433(-)
MEAVIRIKKHHKDTDKQKLIGKLVEQIDEDYELKESDLSMIKKLLQLEEESRSEITSDLAELTSSLKRKAISAKNILDKDDKNLETLEERLEDNAEETKKRNSELRELIDTTKKATCCYWMTIFTVIIVFIWMVIFIKLFPMS